MISQIRNGGLLGAVLAASVAAGPVAVQDIQVVPALQERGSIELGSFPLSTTREKDVLLDIGAAAQVGPVGLAADLVIECIDCRTWGTAVLSSSGVQKDEGLLGDILTFFENPIDSIVSAFDLDVRVDFENVGGHMEFDIKAAAGTSISIPIFESDVSAGIACSADVSVGLLVAVDLIFALDAAIDVEAGFEFSLPEGSFITVDPLTGHIVDKNFSVSDLNQLPITVIVGGATIEAALRVRVQAGTTVEVFGTGFDFELGIFVDLLEYTAVIIGESHHCGLFITESVDLAVGAFALAVVEIDYHKFTAIPAVVVVLLKLELPSICLPAPPHSPTGYPTSGYPTGLPSGYPTGIPSGYPTGWPSGYTTLPTTSGAPYPTGTPSGTASGTASGIASGTGSSYPTNSTITASAPWTTSTVYSTDTITITSCSSTVLHCPASASSEVVVTSTKVQYTTICPVTETQKPTATAWATYPVNTPTSITSPKCLTPVPTPSPSTVYVPTITTPTYAVPTATSYSVLNPGYTVAPTSVTVAPIYSTYIAGGSPSGVASPSGHSVLSTGSLPTASPAPFTAGAARSSGTVMFALAVAVFGAVALM